MSATDNERKSLHKLRKKSFAERLESGEAGKQVEERAFRSNMEASFHIDEIRDGGKKSANARKRRKI